MKKVAIVTGASRGIGREIARELAKNNFTVVANYNQSKKEAFGLKEELEKEGFFLDLVQADVSTRAGVKALASFALEKYKRIDVLVNNAGISEYKLFVDETDEDWNRVMDTNLYSAFAMSQEVVPSMVQQKQGLIINISSIWGLTGASMEVLYSVSKARFGWFDKESCKGTSALLTFALIVWLLGSIATDMNANLTEEELRAVEEETPLR